MRVKSVELVKKPSLLLTPSAPWGGRLSCRTSSSCRQRPTDRDGHADGAGIGIIGADSVDVDGRVARALVGGVNGWRGRVGTGTGD